MRDDEPRSDLFRYAFGYSDKKPSRGFWILFAILAAVALSALVSLQ